MTEDLFDDSLKNKIRDHRSPVPDDMWERIIQKKDKDRRGFLFFFRWFTLLLLGVCLVGYLVMNHAKQKNGPATHALSGQDRKPNVDALASHLNKEAVRKEENTTAVTQYLPESDKRSYSSNPSPIRKKESYSSNPIRALKENEGNFKSVNDEKVVSETAADGAQNSYSERDSLAGRKDDSVLNATGVVNKPVPVVKPVPEKSPADTTQKASVKKTQQDSVDGKKWYLDIYASPDWPMDHTVNAASIMKLSYTVGLRINRAFGKHFSGKIGIQFSRINFTYPDTLSYLNGEKNHLNSFDLPVLAGYSFGTEKMKMTVTAGGIANLYSFTGYSGSIFKTNTGLSLYLGYNVEKKVNQKISIYLEPYYRYRLTSMTIEGVDFFKFIDVVGLSFGARFYFLKPTKK